ncbi:sugar ABC transporter ATP-binding protein [Thermoflavimicrobium dichotomicum]|uniref:Autoinducer 2 import ATP-binding protein LsrA n=1 Tax=Thermoflavimicrobium dichotomicum TaxID=46223 RepID=A0A1I3LGY1_9BACL|nr:sugar ABC transporter ATP-binding protein [Thermoflavimicrobium dichotomicum]SFI83810.1 simple sugar transport system ATP-binding protein [Thermoflavimicrobium dichotomicum]
MNTLTVKHLSKSFGLHPVLRDITISFHPGEVHALLGVNGAGKSTLVKILSGDIQPDHGEIQIGERSLRFSSPIDAKHEGIDIVVQEVDTALVPELSVAENLTIHELLRGSQWIRWKERKKLARQLLQEVGADIDIDKQVRDCTLAEKQMILIARAINSQVKYLILDEPTAPLSEVETSKLFAVIRKLQENGIGIIFISHRLPEIQTIADRVTILRNGEAVCTKKIHEITPDEMIRHMLGKQLASNLPRKSKEMGPPLLEVNQFYVAKTGKTLSLSVHEGEIVGIAGLVGAGKTETARALFAADEHHGTISLKGKKHSFKNPHQAIQAGLALVPEERRKEGILVDFPLAENLSLPILEKLSSWGWIKRQKEKTLAERLVKQLGIKIPSLSHPLRYLSGGNQQKASIGKWLETQADVFIFDEPTKGIDIGAKEDVFQLIRSLAEQGKGILYLTSEVSELLSLADRILVMYNGEIISTYHYPEFSLEKIMSDATGGHHATGTE